MQVISFVLPRLFRHRSAPRCAQRFSKQLSAPPSSRVTTTGISPTKVVLKSPLSGSSASSPRKFQVSPDRKSTRLNSSHTVISYAVFCLKKKNKKKQHSARQQNHEHDRDDS